jgi:hypothetical protein
MNEQQERADFEAWYEGHCLPGEADWFRRDPNEPGEYKHRHTADAWEGWQARAALAAQGVPADLLRAAESIEGAIGTLAEGLEGHLEALNAPLIALRAALAATPAPAQAQQAAEVTMPPIPCHPEPHTHRWSKFEEATIKAYGELCAIVAQAAAKATPAQAQQADASLRYAEGYGRGHDAGWAAAMAHVAAQAQQAAPLTQAQRIRLWNNSPQVHGDVVGRDAFERLVKLVESVHRIGASSGSAA